MPKTKWFELYDQRDANGNLTNLALALNAIACWGCDCKDESKTCLSCLCEAALKELYEKVVEYEVDVNRLTKMNDLCAVVHVHNIKLKNRVTALEAEVKQLNSLLAANRLLTRAAVSEMFQPDGVGVQIAKLEKERDEALAEVERLRNRLQFDPGGSDKIDELEQSNQFLKHRAESVEIEVGRLKAHTWEQERATVVAWLNERVDDTCFDGVTPWEVVRSVAEVVRSIASVIERGEHWKEGEIL